MLKCFHLLILTTDCWEKRGHYCDHVTWWNHKANLLRKAAYTHYKRINICHWSVSEIYRKCWVTWHWKLKYCFQWQLMLIWTASPLKASGFSLSPTVTPCGHFATWLPASAALRSVGSSARWRCIEQSRRDVSGPTSASRRCDARTDARAIFAGIIKQWVSEHI